MTLLEEKLTILVPGASPMGASMSEPELYQLGITYVAVAALVLFFLAATTFATLAELAVRLKAKHILHSRMRHHARF